MLYQIKFGLQLHFFRLTWYQMESRWALNQSEKCSNILNLVRFNKIQKGFLCVYM